jgi:hypothetical protein
LLDHPSSKSILRTNHTKHTRKRAKGKKEEIKLNEERYINLQRASQISMGHPSRLRKAREQIRRLEGVAADLDGLLVPTKMYIVALLLFFPGKNESINQLINQQG